MTREAQTRDPSMVQWWSNVSVRTRSQTDQFHFSWTCFSRKHLIPVSDLSLNTSSSLHHVADTKGNYLQPWLVKKSELPCKLMRFMGSQQQPSQCQQAQFGRLESPHGPCTALVWKNIDPEPRTSFLIGQSCVSPDGSQGWITLHWTGDISTRRCNTRATRVIRDPSHPRNGLFQLLRLASQLHITTLECNNSK